MKTNEDFILRDIAGEKILIATGEASQHFNGMITLNDVAAFIWETIDSCENEDALVDKILDEFDIDRKTAIEDSRDFIGQLIKCGMLLVD